jgi:hypothetical protein
MRDNSAMLPDAPLTGNSSMQATNTITDETGSMTSPGSASEASDGITACQPYPQVPGLYDVRTPAVVDGNDSPSDHPYTDGDGHGWFTMPSTGIDGGDESDWKVI